MSYQEEHILFIHDLKLQGLDWDVIKDKYNKEFTEDKSCNALSVAYSRYGYYVSDKNQINLLKTNVRLTSRNREVAKNLNSIAEKHLLLDDILIAVNDIVDKVKPRIVKHNEKKVNNKHSMSIELLLSDLHFGKKTGTFNLQVARARLVELADVLIKEIENESKIFNVENIIIALMGDIIESYTMHGLESAAGCEFGNSEQITHSTISLFEDILSPVFAYAASKGINVKVVGVTGNHDRTQEHKSFSNAARGNVTWIIYNILMLLSNKSGYTNVVWDISEVNYSVVELYGNTIVYEHGDMIKSNNPKSILTHIANRSVQLKKNIDFFRMGHYHESNSYMDGKVITNGSLCGQDGYADTLGFNSKASQAICYYIDSKGRRETNFYKYFPVYL